MMPSDTEEAWSDIRDLSLEEIDDAIRELEQQVAPALARISLLKRTARGRKAAAASAKARAAKAPAGPIRGRYEAMPGTRGRIDDLAGEFGLSKRTIHRKLGPKASGNS